MFIDMMKWQLTKCFLDKLYNVKKFIHNPENNWSLNKAVGILYPVVTQIQTTLPSLLSAVSTFPTKIL